MAIFVVSCAVEIHPSNFPKTESPISLSYDHFKNGVLFVDIEYGLEVLWSASFINKRAYKENLGVFVPEGLLILPNAENTPCSSRLSVLPHVIRDNKLYVIQNGRYHEVLGIIHSHPDINSLPMPTPRNDYQFSYLGIHNYVMDYSSLFDAYRDEQGDETFVRLGIRNAYGQLPFSNQLTVNSHNNAVKKSN